MSPNRRGILFRSLKTVAMAKSYFASEDSESCPKRSQSVLSANGSTLGMFTGSIDEKLISTDHSMSDTSGNRSLVSAKFQQRTYKNSLRRPETFMDCLSCHQSQGYGYPETARYTMNLTSNQRVGGSIPSGRANLNSNWRSPCRNAGAFLNVVPMLFQYDQINRQSPV